MVHRNPVRVNSYPKIFRGFPDAAQTNCVILARMCNDFFLPILLQLSITPPFYCIQGDLGGNSIFYEVSTGHCVRKKFRTNNVSNSEWSPSWHFLKSKIQRN